LQVTANLDALRDDRSPGGKVTNHLRGTQDRTPLIRGEAAGYEYEHDRDRNRRRCSQTVQHSAPVLLIHCAAHRLVLGQLSDAVQPI
jgi:hypothetical protein